MEWQARVAAEDATQAPESFATSRVDPRHTRRRQHTQRPYSSFPLSLTFPAAFIAATY
jgi:hypothetical protein